MKFRIIEINKAIKLQKKFLLWWFTEQDVIDGGDKLFESVDAARKYAQAVYPSKEKPITIETFDS